MAPEVARLQSEEYYDSKKADIYSLGATLYSIICGELNFQDFALENFSTLSSFKLSKMSQEGIISPVPENKPMTDKNRTNTSTSDLKFSKFAVLSEDCQNIL